MGMDRDHNFEAIHFLSINQRALWSMGADWYKPGHPPEECFDHYSAHDLFKIHFGIHSTWNYIFHKLLNRPWGWKDPRNTFTLTHWLRLFPNAKVIHLIRHGWDVALSLQKRNQRPGEVHVPELNDPIAGFNLWNMYMNQAMSFNIPNLIHIKYEDLTAMKPDQVDLLESFLNRKINKHLSATARKTRTSPIRYPDIVIRNDWINRFYPDCIPPEANV